jgi:hypothetical protein
MLFMFFIKAKAEAATAAAEKAGVCLLLFVKRCSRAPRSCGMIII